jgi:glycosyltransferase involved in cell wall biosynthesis
MQIMKLAYSFKPNLVYTNTSVVPDGAIAAKIMNIMHIWHIHENFNTFKDISFVPFNILRNVITILSSKIIFVSRLALDSLYPNGHAKAVVIHNGVDITQFDKVDKENINGEIKIIFIGALSHRKGPDTLLHAFSHIKKKYDNIRLYMWGVGSDEYTDYLKKLCFNMNIENYTEFMGYAHDVANILATHDLLVLPSRAESFSLVTAEAMAAGIPIIATKCGGPEELIEDGVTGLLVSPENCVEMARAIEMILDHRNDALIMAKRAEQVVRVKFNINIQLDCIIRTIEQAANNTKLH